MKKETSVLVLVTVIATASLVFWYVTLGSSYCTRLNLLSSVLFIISALTGCFILDRKTQRLRLARLKSNEIDVSNEGSVGLIVIDLHTHNEEMSCDDFSFLVVAGPETEKMPESVEKRIRIHQATCVYHQSPAFWKGIVGVPVTPEMEKAALALVAKIEKEA